jgi:hypothetical protein
MLSLLMYNKLTLPQLVVRKSVFPDRVTFSHFSWHLNFAALGFDEFCDLTLGLPLKRLSFSPSFEL